jgi:multidrug efflux pump subunit AcrA (membrane-fusion protein)
LKARYVDLGDAVRKGQLLGVISAPDLDASVAQQVAVVQQSRDNVLTAQSTLRLQQATYARVHTLLPKVAPNSFCRVGASAVPLWLANQLFASNALLRMYS